MPSLIEGYNYDIFISYRQKDNNGDHWVSEFVDALKTELESTFKEEISVYFDINPHDGLLETHDVDASLKDKLKCLIFIPIISRTYCDPKAFAWEGLRLRLVTPLPPVRPFGRAHCGVHVERLEIPWERPRPVLATVGTPRPNGRVGSRGSSRDLPDPRVEHVVCPCASRRCRTVPLGPARHVQRANA